MSGQMCEIKDSDLNKIRFYHMGGCYHCTTAKEFLQEEIDSNKIILLPSHCIEGVRGFPHFVNPKNGKTLTGCPKSKEDLFERLDYKENFMVPSEHESMPSYHLVEYESMPSYPVVEHMETVSTDVLYHHRTGGYSKLSNCWVKQPDYTA